MIQNIRSRVPLNLPGGVFIYKASGGEEISYADENVISLYGCESFDEFLDFTGSSFRGMVHPDDLARVEKEIQEQTTLSSERHDYVHYKICTKNGDIRYVEDFGHLVCDKDGEFFFYVFIVDIEEAEYRKIKKDEWESRVGYRSNENRDKLTGLLYDRAFLAECDNKLSDVTTDWVMIVIDLQHFKLYNEWYGWESGDRALAEIGEQLNSIAEEKDGVAGYFKSDDFAILLPSNQFSTDNIYDITHHMAIEHSGFLGFLPAIGVCYSHGIVSAYTLYDRAVIACQEAKGDSRERIKFFSQAMLNRTENDYRILSDLREALENKEITFWLQPQCRSLNGKIVGAEALARWIKADGRIVSPGVFIPVLERHGFIPDIDKHIWEQVCRWIRSELDAGKPTVPVSVNISPVDIFSMDVPTVIKEVTEKYHLPKDTIKFEITESAYGEGSEKVRAAVQELRSMGFVVLMDDFGSGFSSLNMLSELNVDVIKLDAFFLRMDKSNEKRGMHIIESVVNMAKTMAMPVIVEGVETKEQCEYLMGLGVRYIQGFYFYKPMPAGAFEKLLSQDDIIDPEGFRAKTNEEFRIREFLNDTIYSDSMLNNIIGPAAIYAWHGEDVDIVRFNQQFFQAVDVPDFSEKILSIQHVMPQDDIEELYKTMEKAYEDRLNGADGEFTFAKIDGSAARFHIHFYYLNDAGDQKLFYGSARDVSETSNLHRHMNLLSRFTSRTILLLQYEHGKYHVEAAVHGLEKETGISMKQLQKELDEGVFSKRLVGAGEHVLLKMAQKCAETKRKLSSNFVMTTDDGRELEIGVDADYVDDEFGDVLSILSMRKN